MKNLNVRMMIICLMLAVTGTAFAQDNALAGMKLGVAIDRGLGLTLAINRFNIFAGDDGAALDYRFKQGPLHVNSEGPMYWYIGGGVYADWNGENGVRLPVGVDWHFAKRLDAYAQLHPYVRITKHRNTDNSVGVDAAVGVRYQF